METPNAIMDALRHCDSVNQINDVLTPLSDADLQATHDQLISDCAWRTRMATAIEAEIQRRKGGTDQGPVGIERFF
jgi:hypothetical protein